MDDSGLKKQYVSSSEIPGSTPGKPGGVIAVYEDEKGVPRGLTAAQYEAQEPKLSALDVWKRLRILRPQEWHPDDYRVIYPHDRHLNDSAIRRRLAGDDSKPR